jgi:hypothetical protein
MFAVPAEIPVTTPPVLTVAIAAFSDDQTPPEVELLSVVVEPVQTLLVPPLIAFTVVAGATVMFLYTLVPQADV